ncbi:MAG: hypothetical protein HY581_03900 [Nitrospirae bacterium]|nr:hypothetical protein [Nitrospirota bacterium]
MNASRREGLPKKSRVTRWTGIVVASLLLAWSGDAFPVESCDVAAEQGGMTFPVDRLDPVSRCLIGDVVNRPTTSGAIGPVRMPIAQQLYEFLLDRPWVMASLLQRLEMGTYQFAVQGPNRFWVNDGDGTQGMLSLMYHDQTTRIYHIDGFHEGHIFPMVRARAAVFLRIVPALSETGHPAVETSLISYAQLNDPVLAALVFILRPLVGEAVTRKLTRGFEATTQLGALIAQAPNRVLQLVPSLPLVDPEDQRTLMTLLGSVPQNMSQFQPARPSP